MVKDNDWVTKNKPSQTESIKHQPKGLVIAKDKAKKKSITVEIPRQIDVLTEMSKMIYLQLEIFLTDW